MSTEHGHFHWNELMDFYSETLGWTYESFPMADGGDYAVCMMDGQPVAGMVEVTDEDRIAGLPDCWFPYISVDDIDVRLERAAEAEGSVERPAFDIPGIGRIAIVRDRAGSAVGWITPATEDSPV
jgi:predicted enzyme related to lactoylglutathione lyase